MQLNCLGATRWWHKQQYGIIAPSHSASGHADMRVHVASACYLSATFCRDLLSSLAGYDRCIQRPRMTWPRPHKIPQETEGMQSRPLNPFRASQGP